MDTRHTRRTFLGIAGGVGLAALAGCTAADTPEADDVPIDAQFGYAGASMDDVPTTPDHTVRMRIRPREGAAPEAPPEFYFDPAGLLVQPGDLVMFAAETPDHSVNAYHGAFGRTQRVPDGVGPFSSPVLAVGSYWLYRFETPGVYDLVCTPHEPFGMAMRLVVGEPSGPALSSAAGGDPGDHSARPPMPAAARVLDDPALAADRIVAQERVVWDDLDPASRRLQSGDA